IHAQRAGKGIEITPRERLADRRRRLEGEEWRREGAEMIGGERHIFLKAIASAPGWARQHEAVRGPRGRKSGFDKPGRPVPIRQTEFGIDLKLRAKRRDEM